MALILTERGMPSKTEICGAARIIADPDNECVEYAIIVSHKVTGMWLSTLLVRRIIDYVQNSGNREIYGDVMQYNGTMLNLCFVLGFTEQARSGRSKYHSSDIKVILRHQLK